VIIIGSTSDNASAPWPLEIEEIFATRDP
jgi:hypothetical protein